MSWVTDVVLLANLAEFWDGENELLEPKGVTGINQWLEHGDWAPLVSVADQLGTENPFQACAYGGALSRLDVPAFIKTVASQPWQDKKGVLLLLRDENDKAFTVYRFVSSGTDLTAG